MRKALGLMAVLLVAGSTAVGWCATTIYAAHDQVTFTQTILAGDPAAAEELSVQTYATYDDRLFWDSTTNLHGDAPQTQTEYRFYNTEQEYQSDQSYPGVTIYSATQSGGSNFLDTPKYRQNGLERAYQELYDSAANGQEVKKTIRVADYCEYYPLEGFIGLAGINYDFGIWRYQDSNSADLMVQKKLQEFFRIPVLPTEQLTISLTKYSDGSLGTGTSNEAGEQFYLETQSTVTPTTCYFTFNTHTSEGNIVDTSLIPGGYGIYALDYTAGVVQIREDGITQVTENGMLQLDSLRMVYPIDATEELLQLGQWEADGTLLLYTRIENDYYLTIIATDTMHQVQRLKLHSAQTDSSAWYNLFQNDDYIVTIIDQTVTVLLPNGDGTFHIDMQTSAMADSSYLPWSVDGKAIAYQDGRLAFATEGYNKDTGMRDNVSFDLIVLDAHGIQLCANYQSSLQNDLTESYSSDEIVRLIYDHPIQLAWK